MDKATPVILSVEAPHYRELIIETSEGSRYLANLSAFEKVHCFPKNLQEWKNVSIDSYGLALIWGSRFEVHIDQILGIARRMDQKTPDTSQKSSQK